MVVASYVSDGKRKTARSSSKGMYLVISVTFMSCHVMYYVV